MKPRLYLDIDGVILANEENLSIGAAEFLQFATDNFETYWLTTHCMEGDPIHAIEYIQRTTDKNLRPYLEKLKPTTWSIAKTEAIEFDEPFLWFDDDCYADERAALKDHGVFSSWIEIDLSKHPEQLTHETKLLRSFLNSNKDTVGL